MYKDKEVQGIITSCNNSWEAFMFGTEADAKK